MTLNGGKFATAGNSEGSTGKSSTNVGIGALTLQKSSSIDMSGNSILHFAASGAGSGVTWTGTLSIFNYNGIPVLGNGFDQLLFGTGSTSSTSNLTDTQLGQVSFYSGADTSSLFLGPGRWSTINPGEIVPVPEPSTWAAGILAVSALGYSQRRQFSRLLV